MIGRLFPALLILALTGGCLWAEEQVSAQRLALRELSQKASEGDAKALYDLARLHDLGYDSIPVDSVRSTALYLLAAQKGYAPARNYIGFRFYKGEGVDKNLDSAVYWIQKAADQGDITAAANLGYLYADSPDFIHDEEEAVKWLSKAIEGGIPEAQEKLLELRGEVWRSLPSDSALSLGIHNYLGNAPIVGTFLLETAAMQRNPKALALLGDAYSKGIGVPYNHNKSLEYFFSAAKEGDPSAQFIIAELLEFFPDIHLSDDMGSPSEWYEKAKSEGVSDSETAYRRLYSQP